MQRTLFIASLATLTVTLAGCFGFSASGESAFRPGEDFELTGKTVELKAAVMDLTMHQVYPGFYANLWAFCMAPADPEDTYSANAVEYFNTVETDGTLMSGSVPVTGTFEGKCSVPAPTLRVKQGDNVKVTFENTHFHCHTIHWHGQYVPWLSDGVPGATQHSVCPAPKTSSEPEPIGDNPFVYEFVASRAGTLWYHCHVDTHFHVMQGLYGMFIVEPQDERYEPKDIDKEYTFVYSTLNRDLVEVTPLTVDDPHITHRHGGCGQSGAQGCQNPAADTMPDTWMLNGRSMPYSTSDMEDSVMVVKEGERVRVRMLNAGETFETIHTHGHDMYVTHIDGNPIPPAARYYVDTLLIGPASRYDVVIEMNNPGIWVMHTHVDHHVTSSHQAPGGAMSAIAYESALEETNGQILSFEGKELAGGQPYITPLDIPEDAIFGATRTVGYNPVVPTGPALGNIDETWAFNWALPCATRMTQITINIEPQVADAIADNSQSLQIEIRDRNGDLVANNPTFTLGAGRQFTWLLDARYDALDLQNRDQQAKARSNVIANYTAGDYTVRVYGDAPPTDIHFLAQIDYHESEGAITQEKILAAYDLSLGDGDCDPMNRVFDPNNP